jgi:hypothetical protein
MEIQEEKNKNISNTMTLSHVKIVCKAIFPHEPEFSRIFEMGTYQFTRQFLSGDSRILHANIKEFALRLDEGGANGATFPAVRVVHGNFKGKHFPAFTAQLVNPVTGQALSEEERAAIAHRKMITAKTE